MLSLDIGSENFKRLTARGSTSFLFLYRVLDICLSRTDSKAFIISIRRQAYMTDIDLAESNSGSGELRD